MYGQIIEIKGRIDYFYIFLVQFCFKPYVPSPGKCFIGCVYHKIRKISLLKNFINRPN